MSTYYFGKSPDETFAIQFTQVQPPVGMDERSDYPCIVSITAADTEEHDITLYASRSNSIPYADKAGMWSHLMPTWRFEDLSGNVIESIKTEDTILSGVNGEYTTGFAAFRYIDDMPSTYRSPILLWATMEMSHFPLASESTSTASATAFTSGHSNSRVIAVAPTEINALIPSGLSFTRNGIDPLSSSIYWLNHEIPVVATVTGSHYEQFGEIENAGLGIMYNYPFEASAAYPLTAVMFDFNAPSTSCELRPLSDDMSLVFQRFDNATNEYRIGGYTIGEGHTSAQSTTLTITGETTLSGNDYFATYPMWIANPEANVLHRVTSPFFSQEDFSTITGFLPGSIDHIYTESVSTDYVKTPVDIYSLTGFGGINAMAVDPRYNVWAADTELGRLYKFDWKGTKLVTVELSSQLSSIPEFLSGDASPNNIVIGDENQIYVGYFDSMFISIHDGMTGDLISAIPFTANEDEGGVRKNGIKPVSLDQDIDGNVWVAFASDNAEFDENGCKIEMFDKYFTRGSTPISSFALPVDSYPFDLRCSKTGRVYVTLTHHPDHESDEPGELAMLVSGGSAFESVVSGIFEPSHMTIDNYDNVWFTSDNNVLNVVTPNGTHSHFSVGLEASKDVGYENERQQYAIEGIGCDSSNRMWVINTVDSSLFAYDIDRMTLTGGDLSTRHMLSAQILDYREEQYIDYWTGTQATSVIPETVILSDIEKLDSIRMLSATISYPSSAYSPYHANIRCQFLSANPWTVVRPYYPTTPITVSGTQPILDYKINVSNTFFEGVDGDHHAEIVNYNYSYYFYDLNQDDEITRAMFVWPTSIHSIFDNTIFVENQNVGPLYDPLHYAQLTGNPLPETYPRISLYYIPESATVSGFSITSFSSTFFVDEVQTSGLIGMESGQTYSPILLNDDKSTTKSTYVPFMKVLGEATSYTYAYLSGSFIEYLEIPFSEMDPPTTLAMFSNFYYPVNQSLLRQPKEYTKDTEGTKTNFNASENAYVSQGIYVHGYQNDYHTSGYDIFDNSDTLKQSGLSTINTSSNTRIRPCHYYSVDWYTPNRPGGIPEDKKLGGFVLTSRSDNIESLEIQNIAGVSHVVYTPVTASTEYEKTAYELESVEPITWEPHYATGLFPVHALWARGDWTGQRWSYLNNIERTGTLTGMSSPFSVDSYDDYRFRKFNESWNPKNHMKLYVTQPDFKSNENLFNDYIETMVGGVENGKYSLARRIYEKIANSVQNLHDIDECGIDGLYSLALELDVPIDDYLFGYPEEVAKFMDLASVTHSNIWGCRCQCDVNYFKKAYPDHVKFCPSCNHIHGSNLGDFIDYGTYDLTVNKVPYLAENKFARGTYTKITPSNSSLSAATDIYNLILTGGYYDTDPILSESISALSYDSPSATSAARIMAIHTSMFMPEQWMTYCLYEFTPNPCNTQNIGVVKWDDEYTTYLESASGLDEWYSTSGTIEKTFNYLLHNGCEFHVSGYREC